MSSWVEKECGWRKNIGSTRKSCIFNKVKKKIGDERYALLHLHLFI